jgi:toxin ParE1/3/4
MNSYSFSKHAEQDLKDIRKYTRTKWGLDQAKRYAAHLKQAAAMTVAQPEAAKSFAQIDPFLYRLKCEKHYIWYLSEKRGVVIVAILHEKMDMLSRIVTRLETDDPTYH